jgi:hypothetical protein
LAAKFDEAYNKDDSVAVAAFYTEDAVKVTPHGTFPVDRPFEKDLVTFDFQQAAQDTHRFGSCYVTVISRSFDLRWPVCASFWAKTFVSQIVPNQYLIA